MSEYLVSFTYGQRLQFFFGEFDFFFGRLLREKQWELVQGDQLNKHSTLRLRTPVAFLFSFSNWNLANHLARLFFIAMIKNASSLSVNTSLSGAFECTTLSKGLVFLFHTNSPVTHGANLSRNAAYFVLCWRSL